LRRRCADLAATSPHESLTNGRRIRAAGRRAVVQVTYVSFVPRSKRDKLRQILETEDTGPIQWTEKRTFMGSEFYLMGPSPLVRKAHQYISWWVAQDDDG
jgi:hypothetical protein